MNKWINVKTLDIIENKQSISTFENFTNIVLGKCSQTCRLTPLCEGQYSKINLSNRDWIISYLYVLIL